MTDLRSTTDLDRLVRTWLDADGPSDIRPEIVDHAIQSSLRVRPRRGIEAWLAGVRPWPHRRRVGMRVPSRSVLVLGIIAALLLALAALAVGSQRPRPTPLGEISETGRMSQAVWHPVTEVLADGSVLIVGPVADMWLHAERWDPVTGIFSVVGGIPPTRSVPGFFGSVRLAGGDVLVLARRYESRSLGESGGFALRFDPTDRGFRPAGDFATSPVPAHIADFGFADWPAEVGPDGTVRWTSPIPGADEPTVTYDPVADSFGLESPVPGTTDGFRPTDDYSIGSVVLDDGRRHLWLESRPGSDVTAIVVDSSGAVEARWEWPLVRGEHYEGAQLPDGRVLLVGPSTALADPATGAFEEVDVGVRFAIEARWLDGRILLGGYDPTAADEVGDSGTGTLEARAWIFDPSDDAFSMLNGTPIPRFSTWTVLDDGRVLIVSEDDGAYGYDAPIALVIR